MALIICPECQKQISSHAAACPHCGYPVQEHLNSDLGAVAPLQEPQLKKSKKKLVILLSILACLILGAAGCIGYALFAHNSDTPAPAIQTEAGQEVPTTDFSLPETTAAPETTAPETTAPETEPTQNSEDISVARAKYISDLKDFVLLVEANCVLSISACQKTEAVWSDAILLNEDPATSPYTQTNGIFHGDVGITLKKLYASKEMSDSIDLIKNTARVISEDFRNLHSPPAGLETCFEEAKLLYTEYCKLMNLAIAPVGTYVEFTESLVEYANSTSVQIKLLNAMTPDE